MADLAERVDDLICSFDSTGDTTMDTLSMLIFGWMLFGLVVLCVGKFLYNRFVSHEIGTRDPTTGGVTSTGNVSGSAGTAASKDHAFHIGESVVVAGNVASKLLANEKPIRAMMAKSASMGIAGGGGAGGGGLIVGGASSGAGILMSSSMTSSGGYVPPTPPTRKRLTRKTSGPLISPARSSRSLHLPSATGADTEAVRWVNELVTWLHTDLVILNELLATWVISLNDFVSSSVEEVRISMILYYSMFKTRV